MNWVPGMSDKYARELLDERKVIPLTRPGAAFPPAPGRVSALTKLESPPQPDSRSVSARTEPAREVGGSARSKPCNCRKGAKCAYCLGLL